MRADLWDCAAIAAVKLGACGLVLSVGFHAVSDDDFARVVIAQQWVAAPRLDPSGTSWLPFPFWINGATMALLGRSFAVARGVALVTAVLSAWLVYIAARWLDAGRWGALIGALLACCIPYGIWLGVATVPDGFAASLILFGAIAMRRESPRDRAWGAVALLAATLSRYEAWPVAAVFVAVGAWDAYRTKSWSLVGAAALAALGPVAWIANGIVSHSDPLFFVARVGAYRAALGGSAASPLTALLGYPVAILRCEPELAGLTLTVVAIALFARQSLDGHRYTRLGVALGALVVFLIVGELRNTAPTHHGERAVLAVWLAAATLTGDVMAKTWPNLSGRWRIASGFGLAVVVFLAAAVIRPRYADLDGFADRRNELAIGDVCRTRASATDRLLIDTPDYGFFAVIAGFRHPERVAPLDDRDPRHARGADPFRDPASLAARLAAERAGWLVTTAEHRNVADEVGRLEIEQAKLVLYRLEVPTQPQ